MTTQSLTAFMDSALMVLSTDTSLKANNSLNAALATVRTAARRKGIEAGVAEVIYLMGKDRKAYLEIFFRENVSLEEAQERAGYRFEDTECGRVQAAIRARIAASDPSYNPEPLRG